jgi:uroporphyrinogen decarboxylase
MNTWERMSLTYGHKEADRVPMFDYAWETTLERWRKEGLPPGRSLEDEFDLDHISGISVDNSPRFPCMKIEETEAYTISTTSWGGTEKRWKQATSTPEFIDYKVKNRQDWELAKSRMAPTKDRIDWDSLKRNYPIWKERGDWIVGQFWFGFDVTHAGMVGTERLLMMMIDDPELCQDMLKTELELDIALYEMIMDAGYRFDEIMWWDDMGFKGKQFFSLDMYRELLKPYHQQAIDFAHQHGAKAHLHSCGNVTPFVPELVSMGLDALNPLEVKAGMDPLALKKEFGSKLVLHGGINAVNWDKPDLIKDEMTRMIPELKKGGGYIFASDHSIPDSVSYRDFKEIIRLFKELGQYN